MLDLAKKAGYDGIEPRIVSGHKHGIEMDSSADFRKESKKKAEDSGIALCCVATSCRYSDPANIQQMVDDTKRAIDLAGDVGAPRIRVFGGGIPKDVSREAAIDLVSKSLSSVADLAKARGVIVCMETHDHWCDPANVAAVMKKVNHPNIQVNWDIMHPVRSAGSTMEIAFNTLKPWIKHLHVHDASKETGKLVPIGEGFIDHKTAIQLMQTMKYDGFISGEWIKWEDDPYVVYLARELATMKSYEK